MLIRIEELLLSVPASPRKGQALGSRAQPPVASEDARDRSHLEFSPQPLGGHEKGESEFPGNFAVLGHGLYHLETHKGAELVALD